MCRENKKKRISLPPGGDRRLGQRAAADLNRGDPHRAIPFATHHFATTHTTRLTLHHHSHCTTHTHYTTDHHHHHFKLHYYLAYLSANLSRSKAAKSSGAIASTAATRAE